MTLHKVRSEAYLKKVLTRLRAKHKRIVFTNGCFDILHAGHVYYLQKARAKGDCLVVGLNSDRSVRKIKGWGRPVNSERDRSAVLAALACVDYVMIFREETPLRLIRNLRPDVLVKGDDWALEDIAGAEDVRSWGGRVYRIKLKPGKSTTGLLKKLGAS